MTTRRIIYWFRNDLRLHDQPVLKALEGQSDVLLLPVFCFDERWFYNTPAGFPKTGSIRAGFLLESVYNLKENLNKLHSDLLIAFGKPEDVLADIARAFYAGEICAEKEDTTEEVFVENALKKRVKIPVRFHESKTLLPANQLPFSISSLPDIFTNFKNKIEPLLHQVESIDPPEKLPPLPAGFESGKRINIHDFGLTETAFDSRAACSFTGGESAGLDRLHKYIWLDKAILHYKETRNQLIGENYSSKLSAWLANGSLSTRKVYAEVKKFEKNVQANESTYWLVFELLWRDYFRFVARKYGSRIFLKGGIKNKTPDYKDDTQLFEKWRTGKTGNDFVDANMTELLKTGFMSNRGRQNVASYLCKDLMIDWRLGAAWFESQLIDYDVASNWGNWMYVAGVGNDPRESRYFNVSRQAEMYDPDKSYRRRWLNT